MNASGFFNMFIIEKVIMIVMVREGKRMKEEEEGKINEKRTHR